MRLRLNPGVAANDPTLGVLRDVLTSADNFKSKQPVGLVHEYMMWAADTQWRLSSVLRSEDVVDLVVTRRYLAVGTVSPPAAANLMIYDEMEQFRSQLSTFVDQLESERRRWTVGEFTIVVPDTNVFLHHPHEFMSIDWHSELAIYPDARHRTIRIIVPLIVVDELDGQKRRGQQDVRTRARITLRSFESLLGDLSPDRHAQVRARDENGGAVTFEVFVDSPMHRRLADADSEIIDRVTHLQQVSGRPATLLTMDTGMALRARAAGVKVRQLTY